MHLLPNMENKNTANNPRVNFLIAGAQKSGTTTLHAYLQEHPEIQMSSKKEVHFFNRSEFFKKDPPDYSYYHSFFDLLGADKHLYGEATPAYMYCRDAPKRIWQYNPDMKIIVILRSPIDRAYSHWNMEVARGAETLSFEDAIQQEAERCREALPEQHYVYSYLDRGFYSSQIRELWRFFTKERVLILEYEQLKNDPGSVLMAAFNFLGVDVLSISSFLLKEKRLHKASYKEKMSDETRLFLKKYYQAEIAQLEYLLGSNYGGWLA